MKIPVHIIQEKRRRDQERRRQEEGRRVPAEAPQQEVRRDRPVGKDTKRKVIVIQM